jgi:very-short-patch-repair endonuclease
LASIAWPSPGPLEISPSASDRSLHRRFDFVTLDGKLVVEVDGVTHGTPSDIARDEDRTRILESLGFHVVRVSNNDVYDNLDGVFEMIDQTLRTR